MSSIGGVGGSRPPQHHKPPSFDQIDSDSNGGVSLDEFQASAPKNADKSKTDALFKTMDSDNDGSVSKTEMDAFKQKAKKADDALNSFLFSLQSQDPSSTQPASASDGKDIFSQIDTDSSGGVSKDEFAKAFGDSKLGSDRLNQLFSAIDKNGDGSVSQDEVKQFQTSMQGNRGHHGHHGPPPTPPADVTNATQAYGSASTLTSTASNTNTAYAKSA